MCENCNKVIDQAVVSYMFEMKKEVEGKGFIIQEIYYDKEKLEVKCNATHKITKETIRLRATVTSHRGDLDDG